MTAKSDVMVKLVLVFFISLLSFSIGTFVGKKYSDNQHKLASLEPGTEHRDVASIVDEHGKAESTVSDEDIAKLAEEFADDKTEKKGHGEVAAGETAKEEKGHGEEKAEKHDEHGEEAPSKKVAAHEAKPEAKAEAKAETKPEAKRETASHGEEPSHAAKNLAAGKEPTEGHQAAASAAKATAENRQPSSLPKDVAQYSVGKFTVQIGSFGTETEAKKRAEDMKGQGYSAFYVPAQVQGKTWYRVNVGLFATSKEATDYRADLMKKSKVEGALIQKISN